MSPTGDITIYKSQLFRTCGAPTAADRIRNPGYRPTYSYGLARSDIHEFAHASMAHSWLPSGTFIVHIHQRKKRCTNSAFFVILNRV